MPIRFRCPHCNQLMGIARRKAGMTVHCPTCQAPVIVPAPEVSGASKPPHDDVLAPLFEREDFAAFLDNPPGDPPASPAEPASPSPAPIALDIPAAPELAISAEEPSTPRPPGLLLSPVLATCLTVAIILLVALAFGAGLLVDHYLIR